MFFEEINGSTDPSASETALPTQTISTEQDSGNVNTLLTANQNSVDGCTPTESTNGVGLLNNEVIALANLLYFTYSLTVV